jgi:hypothetical protein
MLCTGDRLLERDVWPSDRLKCAGSCSELRMATSRITAAITRHIRSTAHINGIKWTGALQGGESQYCHADPWVFQMIRIWEV